MSYEYLTDSPTARDLNPEAWDAFWSTDHVTERDYLAYDSREAHGYQNNLNNPTNLLLGATALESLRY